MAILEFVRTQLLRVSHFIMSSRSRDERGLSQSVEAAILIAAAVTIGLGIAAIVGVYVTSKMSGLG